MNGIFYNNIWKHCFYWYKLCELSITNLIHYENNAFNSNITTTTSKWATELNKLNYMVYLFNANFCLSQMPRFWDFLHFLKVHSGSVVSGIREEYRNMNVDQFKTGHNKTRYRVVNTLTLTWETWCFKRFLNKDFVTVNREITYTHDTCFQILLV